MIHEDWKINVSLARFRSWARAQVPGRTSIDHLSVTKLRLGNSDSRLKHQLHSCVKASLPAVHSSQLSHGHEAARRTLPAGGNAVTIADRGHWEVLMQNPLLPGPTVRLVVGSKLSPMM